MFHKHIVTILLAIAAVAGFATLTASPLQTSVTLEDERNLQHLASALDLQPRLKGETYKEGLNLIHTTPKGIKISANVQIVNWVVTDPEGREIPTTLLELSMRQPGQSAARVIRCWHCYKNPDGSFDCFEIPCPFRGGGSLSTLVLRRD